jgi:hypothetical protein
LAGGWWQRLTHLARSIRRTCPALLQAEITGDDAYPEQAAERYFGRRVNHGFETFELLPDNIGWLSLRVFAPPAIAG